MTHVSELPLILGILVWTAIGSAFADGTLSVVTEPEGVEAWLDGDFIGLTPIKLKKVEAGTYSLKLVDPLQHTSSTETIEINNHGQLTVEKTLQSRFGELAVSSDPPGANVCIVADMGKTPLTNRFMNPGAYTLEIRHPDENYLLHKEDVTINQGQSATVSASLTRTKLLNRKNCVRLLLGAVAAAGFTWALVEQNTCSRYSAKASFLNETHPAQANKYSKSAQDASLRRTLGIIAGGISILTLEYTILYW
ncbi:MAG: PEGA domain-containing protein [Chitinispirillaceae bacterium]